MKKVDFAALKKTIKFTPTDVQKEILKGMGRFTIVASSKRLGKSMLAAYLALRELFLPRHVVWVVGPNYELASRVWDYVTEWIDMYFNGEHGPFRINRHDRIIENTTTGAKMWMKTTETREGLLGKGLDLVVIDEAARIDNGIWDGYIRPNLLDKNGRAFIISNPYGYNWFYDIYTKGLRENRQEHPDHVSFHFSTAIEDDHGNIVGTNNPYAARIEELKALKKSLPRDIWIVEYMGEFREGAGQRFKDFDKCIDASAVVENQNEWFEPPIPGHLYFLGVDIAKMEDFTVVCVIDRMNHRLVGFYRVNGVSWEYMRQKVVDISKEYYDAEITLDATGHGGDMFAESLADIGANINTEFKYTNKTKGMLIDKLALMMERGTIHFPRLSILIEEMRSFTYRITDSGNVKLGSSKHDDTVNALALGCWNLNDEPLNDSFEWNVYQMRGRTFN